MAGSGKKGGLGSALTGNGCLRYVFMYVGALVLLLAAIGTGGFGLLSRLGLPSPNARNTGTISVASQGVAPAPTAAAAPQTGGSAPTGGGANVSTAGQPAAGNSLINSMPLPGAQGALITPYVAPAFYIVQPGDTLDTVAAMYGLTRDDLRSYNRPQPGYAVSRAGDLPAALIVHPRAKHGPQCRRRQRATFGAQQQ